ncbi:hypothetical protein K2X05_03185, partial [bacterium]|nr:hypothetical protein [bacterium]
MISLRKTLKIAGALALVVIAANVHAEQVAAQIYRIDKTRALEIMLSDQVKGGFEKGLGECQGKGMRMVLIRLISETEYPPITGYAQGCWYAKGDQIFIEATTFHSNKAINFTFEKTKFTTLNVFKTWNDYGRYKPLTVAQALRLDQEKERNEKIAKETEERQRLIRYIEGTISCTDEPINNISFVEELVRKGFLKPQNIGSRRLLIHEAEEGILIFGKKLKFVSGAEGVSYVKFRKPAYTPSHTYPT